VIGAVPNKSRAKADQIRAFTTASLRIDVDERPPLITEFSVTEFSWTRAKYSARFRAFALDAAGRAQVFLEHKRNEIQTAQRSNKLAALPGTLRLLGRWHRTMKRYALYSAWVTLVVAAFSATPAPFDWPQWQGPDRNAISRETGLLRDWPKDGPPLAWQVKGLGGGDSAPSIAAGRIYGMSHRANDEGGEVQVVWALSESDGEEVWVTALGPAFPQRMPQGKEGPACTPTVDGERLYVLGLGGELACLQAKDGKLIWQRGLQRDFGGQVPTWSYRESPLIDGEKVICTPGGEDATLVALNKSTGQTIWKSQVPGNPKAAYASAIAIDFEGQRQYVQLTQRALVGIAASDGKFLWRYDRAANSHGINCSTPIHRDDLVFAASAYGAGGGLVKLSRAADGGVEAEEVYFTKKMQNHHGGMILFDNHLYGANGGNEGGALACLEFRTGTVLWDERDNSERRAPKGSLALADGLLYYRTESGTMLLIEPNPEEYVERGRFEQPDRSAKPAWAHPVIANGKLYVRDQDVLFCYDVKAQGT
jgi:outer membrane protein assembly factor BamB